MTLRNLYEIYKQGIGDDQPIILCDYKNGDGYRISDIHEFDVLMQNLNDHDLYLMNKQDGKDFVYFEYFKMNRVSPVVAIIRHPYLSNAYWKEKPDHIIDITTINDRVYRYISVDYGYLLKENIIEFPTSISEEVYNICKKRFPQAFISYIKESDYSYSIVFTNTDRFSDPDKFSYYTFDLKDIFPELKNPTIKSVSQKIFKELKALT